MDIEHLQNKGNSSASHCGGELSESKRLEDS